MRITPGSPWWKSSVAPRPVMHPVGKARRGSRPAVCDRPATRPREMRHRSNAAGLLPRAASGLSQRKVYHSPAGALRLAALLLGRILPVCSLVEPCQPGVAVRTMANPSLRQSTRSTGVVTWLLLIWVSVALMPGVAAAQPDRVVAIGDIHGAAAQFRLLLEITGLTDSSQRWTGGRTTLVQTGDYNGPRPWGEGGARPADASRDRDIRRWRGGDRPAGQPRNDEPHGQHAGYDPGAAGQLRDPAVRNTD